MSILIETGTASSASEAYASVAYCDAYHAAIGNSTWVTLLEVQKEQALRRATIFMSQNFRLQWKGSRVNSTQALDWPRYNVEVADLGVFNVISPDTVPILVQQANAELALLAGSGNLNPNRTQKVASKQVGPIKIVYDESSPAATNYAAINDLLRPLLQSSGGAMVKLRRV